ncbi:hypothetical protein FXO37_06224 [Capsicum annuum]|nr:hypothetical protein FXO37_06224 [Capsicum annuum]
MSLFYSKDCSPDLIGHADVGYLSDPHKARSQIGYMFICGGTVISWRYTKQSIIATSSNHAEIIAIHEASRECLALRHCFVLEDPPDDRKTSSDSDRPTNGLVDPEDKKDEDDNVEMQKEEKLTLVIDEKSLLIGEDKKTKGETNIDKKCEEQDGENHEQKNEKELEEATHLVSTSDKSEEKSDASK